MSKETHSSVPVNNNSTGEWWRELGLNTVDFETRKVLKRYIPTVFEAADHGESATFAQLVDLLTLEHDKVLAEKEEALKRQELKNLADFNASFERKDAAEIIVDGAWAGFTVADAFAWCHNLFWFERRGIAHPGSQLHFESLRKLEKGVLPEVFGYPERARKLAARGVSPQEYRELKVRVR